MGCIENEQKISVELTENNNSLTESEVNYIDNFYPELDKAAEIAYHINQMGLIDFYTRPKVGYIFDEEVFYMNESERAKIEYETARIEQVDTHSILFVNLNKIEEFGTSKYNNTQINAIVHTAFTPMYKLDDEQANCIIFSRNILLKHCSTGAEKITLSEDFKTIDTWGKFRDSLVYANVPMNIPDSNRTFIIGNVENMSMIIDLEWTQADLEQYFEFLDSSGFNSSENVLIYARQFRIAKQCINNESSDREKEKIDDARNFVIANFPQYSANGIDKSDIEMYLNQCDNKA